MGVPLDRDMHEGLKSLPSSAGVDAAGSHQDHSSASGAELREARTVAEKLSNLPGHGAMTLLPFLPAS